MTPTLRSWYWNIMNHCEQLSHLNLIHDENTIYAPDFSYPPLWEAPKILQLSHPQEGKYSGLPRIHTLDKTSPVRPWLMVARALQMSCQIYPSCFKPLHELRWIDRFTRIIETSMGLPCQTIGNGAWSFSMKTMVLHDAPGAIWISCEMCSKAKTQRCRPYLCSRIILYLLCIAYCWVIIKDLLDKDITPLPVRSVVYRFSYCPMNNCWPTYWDLMVQRQANVFNYGNLQKASKQCLLLPMPCPAWA